MVKNSKDVRHDFSHHFIVNNIPSNNIYFINIGVVQSFLPLRKIVIMQYTCEHTIYFLRVKISVYNTAYFINIQLTVIYNLFECDSFNRFKVIKIQTGVLFWDTRYIAC